MPSPSASTATSDATPMTTPSVDNAARIGFSRSDAAATRRGVRILKAYVSFVIKAANMFTLVNGVSLSAVALRVNSDNQPDDPKSESRREHTRVQSLSS